MGQFIPMTVKNAIDILRQQKAKIEDPNHTNDETWVFQTASYIKEFFGDNSPEYKFIARFTFQVLVQDDISNEDIRYFLLEKRTKAKTFLDNCIETLQHKGLFKEPKQNFLSNFSTSEMYSFLLAIGSILITIGFFFGNMYSDKQNTDLRQDKKVLKDSLIILKKLTPSNKISPTRTNKIIKNPIENNNPN